MWLILASKTTGQTKKPYFNPSTILGPKWPICPEQTFFSTNHHYFDLPIRPFYCAKLKKKFLLTAGPELRGCAIFGPKLSICSKQKLFWKNYQYLFHLTHGPFHCAKFLKFFTADPELWGCAISGPKMTHFPKWDFFQKTC